MCSKIFVLDANNFETAASLLNASSTNLGFIAGNGLHRELDVRSFKYGVLLQDVLLGLIMAKRLQRGRTVLYHQAKMTKDIMKREKSKSECPYLPSIETLEKDDTHRPHIHLIGDLWRFFTNHKTFRRQIPGQIFKRNLN